MFEHRLRIYAEDTDFTGVVYHANYLKYTEHTRTEWLNHLGIPLAELSKNNYFFAVRQADISYHKPARMGDCLIVTAEATSSRRTSMSIKHKIYRCPNLETSIEQAELINDIQVVVVCINEKFRPTALPKKLKEVAEND